jgi:serine/threonine-protein kinase
MVRLVSPARETPTLAAGRPPPESGIRPAEAAGARRAGAFVNGRYRLLAPLGRGGMGEVWRAEHLALRAEVAIKFPAASLAAASGPAVFERLRFEAQIAARLAAQTPHVVAVHDAGTDDDGPFVVMEYVRGRTLREALKADGPLPIERATALVAQVAEALAGAHALGVAHRDLKPSNLLLVERPGGAWLVKVADFGIAKALREDLAADLPEETAGGVMVGSPAYMSPEHYCGSAPTERDDLWALAVIAYEAITGKQPFHGRSFADLFVALTSGRFLPPSSRRAALSPAVDVFFARALAKEPARRFHSAEALAQAFAEAAAGPPGPSIRQRARGLAASIQQRLLARG